ncbi:hypothetical protein Bbelb_154150 [Branchiostoma belcheri]|nr:hypothetical protein Bbelb_154150 [Branchiostoma belcheri]
MRASTSDARAPYVPYGRSTCEYGLLTVKLQSHRDRTLKARTTHLPLAQRTMHAIAHGQTWRADHTFTPCATVRVTCVDVTPSPRFQKKRSRRSLPENVRTKSTYGGL